ncbi:D-glycerate dehydrogenase [Herbaspirillum sp. ST 5-3]|uniref:2-hydroxyacid dehydrogenase n=1 Tax=Oxalobacteraceae TaxID=75682 RepID=UPI001B3BE1D1|nr:D-glycerate dehydrogenase [Herbaspirillum sp. ST 5-3]
MKNTIAVIRPMPSDIIALLRQQGTVLYNPDAGVLEGEALAQHMAQADAVLVSALDRIDAALIARCPKLRVIANIGVGYNNIDVDACTARGIMVTNTPGSVDDATADLAFGLMLAAARRLVEVDRFVRERKWGASAPPMGLDIHHRVLGIVGFGRIGKTIARRARGFDMDVRYFKRRPLPAREEGALGVRYQPLADLLRESDFVLLQMPYGPESHHMIGAVELAMMKKTAVLINTARGGVVDDAALVDALKSRTIAAAGLDVFEDEPHPHPGFLSLDNVVLAPHIGSATMATRHAMAMQATRNLIAALHGTPLDLVNP